MKINQTREGGGTAVASGPFGWCVNEQQSHVARLFFFAIPMSEKWGSLAFAAFREPHHGVLTGSHGGRCDSHRKIFRFMPKVSGGVTQSWWEWASSSVRGNYKGGLLETKDDSSRFLRSSHNLLLNMEPPCPSSLRGKSDVNCSSAPGFLPKTLTCDSVWNSWHFAIWWTPAGPLTCCHRTPPPPASTWKRCAENELRACVSDKLQQSVTAQPSELIKMSVSHQSTSTVAMVCLPLLM